MEVRGDLVGTSALVPLAFECDVVCAAAAGLAVVLRAAAAAGLRAAVFVDRLAKT